MPLIKDGAFVEDRFTYVEDDAPLPEGAVIVSFTRWQDEKDALIARGTPLGVKLLSGEEPAPLKDDLDKLDVIALDFPMFKNGRAYSYARLLRSRYGYKGEVRATGDVLRDQLFFMARCGFDAFEVSQRITLDAFKEALGEISVVYQPASDGRKTVLEARHGGACLTQYLFGGAGHHARQVLARNPGRVGFQGAAKGRLSPQAAHHAVH